MLDKYVRVIPESQMADINYVINQSDIKSTELKAEDIVLLKEYIKQVSADQNRKFKSLDVSSYASPDGKYDLNEKLSAQRGGTADKFIKKEFEKVEAAKAEGFINSKTTAEDWDGFKLSSKNLLFRIKI